MYCYDFFFLCSESCESEATRKDLGHIELHSGSLVQTASDPEGLSCDVLKCDLEHWKKPWKSWLWA